MGSKILESQREVVKIPEWGCAASEHIDRLGGFVIQRRKASTSVPLGSRFWGAFELPRALLEARFWRRF